MEMKRTRIASGLLGALGLAAILAGPAMAAPGDEALIPEGTTGSLTVHKFTQPPSYGDDSHGMELPASAIEDLTPLSGATFKIQKVTEVDLGYNAGWQKAQQAVDAFDPFNPTASLTAAGFGLASPQSQTTGKTGLAQFTKLPVGLYLVEETATPVVAANEAVTAAMPFLITVPLTDPADLHQWVYNVHAYPKNVVSSVGKTVVDNPAYGLGDTVDWPITSTIPGGSVTTKYEVADTLDTKLAYVSTKVSIDGKSTSDFTAVKAGSTVVTSLGATARQAAFDALQNNADAKVLITHTTTVIAAGEITNEAVFTFQREGEPETEVPSDQAETKFGGINVLKHNREGEGLSGAVFQVRAAHVNDFSKAEIIDVNGVDAWTTDSSGKVSIEGLRYSGFADGATVGKDSGKYNFYWLVETKAPVGYELLANPIPFTIDSQTAQAVTVDVVNTPHNAGGQLPKTGASGTIGIIAGGLVLLACGAYLTMRTARRDGTKI